MAAEKGFEILEGGGVTSPAGFKAAGVIAGLKKSGKADMAVLFSERPANVAGSFTSCLFEAAPVILCKERIKAGSKLRAVVVNSGNANACTGADGYARASKTAELAAAALNVSADEVFVSSTGRIGVPLPMDKIKKGVEEGVKALSAKGGADAARAIMTTDTRPKEAAVLVETGHGKYSIGAMTKGAGMIAPKLQTLHATMLCYITTDAGLEAPLLSEILGRCSGFSFNRITIDGDTSTNDTVLLIANGASGVKIAKGSPEAEDFESALLFVMQDLAKKMVMDGEGVTKFVTVEVAGAPSSEDARLCATSIANSLLCKTAWFGCDPNWGRILAAAGYSGAKFTPGSVSMDYDEMPVVRNGADAGTPEATLAEVMKRPEFTIRLDLGSGKFSHTIWTNDISYEYVKINADYHT
jgi:glutamate N-acetyltransferase/amino-acid N-acetyltransferase